jgi:hypothetical protein
MLAGAINGTGYTSTSEAYLCEQYLLDEYNLMKEVVSYWQAIGSDGSQAFFDGLNSLVGILYHFENSLVNCYAGALEFEDVYLGYNIIESYTTYLAANMLLNFGLVYNNIMNLILFFMQDSRGEVTGAFDIGLAVGEIFNYILFPDDVTLADKLPNIYSV